MDFLSSPLKCIAPLLWALLALGYPLYASIRAMETNSDHQLRKLITYWILFSLMSLFDLAFVNFIQWITIWTYIKLVVICCLTLPRFQGSYHVYKSFLQPYFQVNIEEIINKKNEYVKENDTEALQKLISTEENKVVEPTETVTAPATKLMKKKVVAVEAMKNEAKKAPAAAEEKAVAVEATETKMGPAASEEKAVAAKPALTEWSCGICQVKTSSETIFNDHLQGKKHKAKYQALEAQYKSVSINHDSKMPWENKAGEPTKTVTAATTKSMEKTVAVEGTKKKNEETQMAPAGAEEKAVAAKPPLKEWTCGICQVKTSSETTFNAHLQGKKHKAQKKLIQDSKKQDKSKNEEVNKAKNEQGKLIKCHLCGIWCSGDANMMAHLYGKKHLSRVNEAISDGSAIRVNSDTVK